MTKKLKSKKIYIYNKLTANSNFVILGRIKKSQSEFLFFSLLDKNKKFQHNSTPGEVNCKVFFIDIFLTKNTVIFTFSSLKIKTKHLWFKIATGGLGSIILFGD
jgi:hypothetical protein